MDKQPIGERIKEARKKRGVSQKELAAGIGITQPSLSQIEGGRTEPREQTVLAIARFLDDDLGDPGIGMKLRGTSPSTKRPWDALMDPILVHVRRHPLYAYLFAYRMAQESHAFRDLMKDGMLEILEDEIEPLLERQPKIVYRDPETDEVSAISPITPSDVMLAPIVAKIEGAELSDKENGDIRWVENGDNEPVSRRKGRKAG